VEAIRTHVCLHRCSCILRNVGIGPDLLEIAFEGPALEILAHRFVWTIVFLGILLSCQERWRESSATFAGDGAHFFVWAAVSWLA